VLYSCKTTRYHELLDKITTFFQKVTIILHFKMITNLCVVLQFLIKIMTMGDDGLFAQLALPVVVGPILEKVRPSILVDLVLSIYITW
jgi:hypothetical protein